MSLCLIKWRPLIFFAKLHKSSLLLFNIFTGVGQFLANESPLKSHEKYFLFHLNKLNMLLAYQILNILCIFIKPNVWCSWSLKILAIKRWLLINFVKVLQDRHFAVGGPRNIVEFTAIFVCLLLSWSRRYLMKWSSSFDSP